MFIFIILKVKFIYYKIHIINIGNLMGENNKDKLYKDAIYWHLIGKGYTDFMAEMEARRILEKNKKI